MGSVKGQPRGKYKSRKIKPSNVVFCATCDKSFKRLPILEHHIKSVHLNYRSVCPMCQKKFISNSICYRHIKETHHIRDYSKLKIIFSPSHDPVSQTHTNKSTSSFPSMSDAIMIKRNKTFGTHLVANRNIVAGDQLMTASAFACVEYVSCTDPSKCFNCGRGLAKEERKIQCANCIDVWLCSNICSSNRVHRQKCDSFHKNVTRIANQLGSSPKS